MTAKEIANSINKHLENDGVITITTYTKQWQYEKKHAGMFYADAEGNLRVKSGKSSMLLSHGEKVLVNIQAYVYQEA